MTDDAFISFRYARNLSHGHGLTFNPGGEHVEGYSNFLWVLILAACDRLGVAPERAANPISLLATVALWALVVRFALRSFDRPWLALVPAFGLALTRSVAVWSTSGLETRWFELLVVAAGLRWAVEIEAWAAGRRVRALAAWAFALAAWTRPDGLLLATAAFAAGAGWLAARGHLDVSRFARGVLPFVALVAAHFVFRLIYYGDWLPNTYYAKVGGQLWWDAGLRYLAAFVLEYGLWLWIPLLVLGVFEWRRLGRGFFPLLAGALVLPHALSVAAIGGDYFEYRPLDLYFSLVLLVLAAGIAAAARRPWRAAVTTGCLGVMAVGLWELPWQSHRQFPPVPVAGFPAFLEPSLPEARTYLLPERSPVYRLPGLRIVAARHRGLVHWLSRRFVGIRAEEHAVFATSVIAEGKRLRRLVDEGIVPADLYVAMGATGALPYYSDLRTLDMLGLNDRRVAHGRFDAAPGERLMAHGKRLSWPDAVERGVDLFAADPHLLLVATSDDLLTAVREAAGADQGLYAAEVGDRTHLLCMLPQGPERTRGRAPRLEFRKLSDPAFEINFLDEATAGWRDSLSRHPDNLDARLKIAWLLLARTRYDEARALYLDLAARMPRNGEVWEGIATCDERLGDLPAARAALETAVALASGPQADALRARLAALGR